MINIFIYHDLITIVYYIIPYNDPYYIIKLSEIYKFNIITCLSKYAVGTSSMIMIVILD